MRSKLLLAGIIVAVAISVVAQTPVVDSKPTVQSDAKPTYKAPVLSPEVEKDKRYALELRNSNKLLEALPWFEKVVQAEPNDAESVEELAACLLAHSANAQDPAQKRAERVRARELLLHAQKLGYNSDYVETLLATLPEDGAEPRFSTDAEVDRIMKRAEAAFAVGKFEDAKKAYLQALVLEPKNYAATVFIGDVYFVTHDYPSAGEWFSRAVEIEPNRELAYRYWGDALLESGKLQDARKKYIEAVVAQPYERSSWNGLNKWEKYSKQPLTWYRFQSPNAVKATEPGKINIMIDSNSLSKKDGSSAWMMYDLSRAAWQGERFKKEFPNEKQYRHSLKEEAGALSVVASAAENISTGKKGEKLNPDLEALLKLNKRGFLEPYVLLNGVDRGISQDYEQYRKEHRDKLFQYLDEIVVPPVPKSE